MKILLVNDNPVVNKLVTLSAQKTSDELEVVNSLDEISQSSYDLLVIDDTLFSDELYDELNKKVKYAKSLFICSRDTEEQVSFSQTLKKPFLPTDLVEIFSMLGREAAEIDLEEEIDLSEEEFDFEELGSLEEIDDSAEIEDLDELSIDDELGSLEDLEELEELKGIDDFEENTENGESVLDTEEAQKVKDLLEETEVDIDEFMEDDIDLESVDEDLELEEFEDDISLDENLELELEETPLNDEVSELEELELDDVEENLSDNLEDLDLDFDSEELDMDEESIDESTDDILDDLDLEEEPLEESSIEEPEVSEELDLESQIESAVEELSQEELDSEVDEETLLDIVASDIDSLDGLTARDLKIAVGEEVEDEISESVIEEKLGDEVMHNSMDEEVEVERVEEEIAPNTEIEASPDGVEALKNLLAALSDKNVAASMKGMKISINITLGDN